MILTTLTLLPLILFWAIVLCGRSILGWKGVVICIGLWVLVLVGFAVLDVSPYYFISFQALFDVVLLILITSGITMS